MDAFDEVGEQAAVMSLHSFEDLMASDKIVFAAFRMAALLDDGYSYLCWLIAMMCHLNARKTEKMMYDD